MEGQVTGQEDRAALRPKDVAKRWSCSERHIRGLMDSKKLSYFKLGVKLVRIPLDAVEEYEQCNLISASSDTGASSPQNGARKTAADFAARLVRMTGPKRSGV